MSKHAGGNPPSQERTGSRLDLPDLDYSKAAGTAYAHLSPKHGYRHAIDEFIQWYCWSRVSHLTKLSPTAVTGFSSKIATSPRERSTGNLAPLHRPADEAADGGLLSPELSASTRRVKGVKELGG